MSGTVKWFSDKKGYGFITADPDESGDVKEYFFHFTSIQMEGYKKLVVKDRVTFDIQTNEDGKCSAINVKKVS